MIPASKARIDAIARIAGVMLALALEFLALRFALVRGSGLALTLHVVASAVGAGAMWSVLPNAYRTPRAWALTYLFVTALLIPLIGIAGLVLGVIVPLHRPRPPEHAPWTEIEEPELPRRPPPAAAIVAGEGALIATLRQNRDPNRRLRAVMAARQMRDKEMIPIVRVALKDRVDDVRLLAYSMLDRKEQGMLTEIQGAMGKLATAATDAERVRLERRIAESYWELAYLGLASGEVLTHVLESARTHIESARKLDPKNPGLAFLQGRVLLAMRKLDESARAFTEAGAFGFARNQVIPYLAEVAFLARRYKDVVRLLDDLDPLAKATSPLDAVVRYWTP